MPGGQESSQTSPEELQTSPAQPKPSPEQLQTSPAQFQTSPAQPQTLTWLLPHTWMRDPTWRGREWQRAGGAWGQHSPEGDMGRSQKGPLPLPFISAVDKKKKRNTFPAWMFFSRRPRPISSHPRRHGNGPTEQMGLAAKSPLEANAQGHTPWGQRGHPPAPLPSSSHCGEALVAPRGVLAGRRDVAPPPKGPEPSEIHLGSPGCGKIHIFSDIWSISLSASSKPHP